MVEVRPARTGDVEAILAMGAALHAESPHFRTRHYSEQKVRELILRLIEDDGDRFLCLVAEREGEPIGYIGGVLVEDWFGDDTYAADISFYVVPPCRGGRAALQLVMAFERWARERGATRICPATSTQVRSESVLGFYAKLGYCAVGHAMSKDLD